MHCVAHLGFLLALALVFQAAAAADDGILAGYTDYAAMRGRIDALAKSKLVKIQSLAKTRGGRDVLLVSIGAGNRDEKPAILVVGGVDPPHIVGSELALRLAERLVAEEKTKEVDRLLRRLTFYIIPRASPDACEAMFRKPYVERAENDRPTDDDHDGAVDEDGPDDLNGDGMITMMRVEDPASGYLPHSDDSRLMVKADAKRNQRGRWTLYTEGRDNDGDGAFNEDVLGGVAFNRNFTFRYPFFEKGAGPHQVSEPETRGVADFAFDRTNIAAVLSFSRDDNLVHPWKPDAAAEKQRIKTSITAADAGYVNYLAEQYRAVLKGKDGDDKSVFGGEGASDNGRGSFAHWAYYHFGRWSLACRGWWVPEVKKDTEKKDTEKKSDDDAQVREDLAALRWFDREKIDGFVPWRRIEHPDFPGKRVEVGGFKPFYRWNPPGNRLDGLAEKHFAYLKQLGTLLPELAVQEVKTEARGGGAWRVTAVVLNKGYLPTMCEMGRISREPQSLQAELELPTGVTLAFGNPRTKLPVLAGNGGKAEHTWLVVAPPQQAVKLKLKVWSPVVGSVSKVIDLPAEEKKP